MPQSQSDPPKSQTIAACVTMVRDDPFFLRKWVDYYGDLFGRENLYVVSHGRGEDISRIAAGCNIIGIPGDPLPNFDAARWRLLNSVVNGLRNYFRHVIVGDVDELVVVDPASGETLLQRLARMPRGPVVTPFGLELVHRRTDEPSPVMKNGDEERPTMLLGPRSHVRIASLYTKPCVVSAPARLSRGGHYSDSNLLVVPGDLYLFHLKYCDFALYARTMEKRNAVAAATGVSNPAEAMIGREWFAAHRKDEKHFREFETLPVTADFDFSPVRAAMQASWGPRNEEYYHFARQPVTSLYRLPERFFGLF
ncbi:MAG: glycosyltransferase family 2 protein [Paracoccaceae bacterium]